MCNANIRRDLWPQAPIDFDLANSAKAKAKNSKLNIQLPAGIMHFRLPTSPKPCPIWLCDEGEACTRTLGQRQVASSGACRVQIFGELWAAIYLWRRGQTNAIFARVR